MLVWLTQLFRYLVVFSQSWKDSWFIVVVQFVFRWDIDLASYLSG